MDEIRIDKITIQDVNGNVVAVAEKPLKQEITPNLILLENGSFKNIKRLELIVKTDQIIEATPEVKLALGIE